MATALCHTAAHITTYDAVAPGVSVGRRHLGLLNAGAQPRRGSGGERYLWMTGEFYHHKRTREALIAAGELPCGADDAALAMAVFERDGVEGLTRLEGAFTIAIWDGDEGIFWLINDRFGLYPHYYAHCGRSLVFAPELGAVLKAPVVPRRLDETALCEFLRFQQLLGEKTWLEDVRLLPAAAVLRYSPADNELRLSRSWDLSAITDLGPISLDEAVEEAERVFQRAIDAMVAPPLRPGVFLSGGMDGRLILAFAADRAPLSALTFGDPGSRDMRYGTRLAQLARVPHRRVPLTSGQWVMEHAPLHLALTEGQHSFIHMHGITALPAARELMDVNLSGWDGGSTLGAFAVLEDHVADRYYRLSRDEVSLVERLYQAFCRDITWPGLNEGEAAALLSGSGRERLRDRAYESLRAEVLATSHYAAHRRVDYFIVQHLLRRSLQYQIVTQRSAIEVRCPYFDYSLVSLMFGLPDSVRTTPLFRRKLLTRRAPALATVPYEKDDRLPHSSTALREAHGLLQRGKSLAHRVTRRLFPPRTRLYADYEQYLRTDMRAWAEAILFDRRTQERGLFEPAAVRALWTRHVAGEQLWTIGKVAPLISLELTLRRLFDEPATLPVGPTPAAREL